MPATARRRHAARQAAVPRSAVVAERAGRAIVWTPHAGFQQDALRCGAYEALYGGAAGPGKTDVLLMGTTRFAHEPWYRGLFLRRTFPELREVMDRAHARFPRLGATWKASEKRWTWPSGATLEFGYCRTWEEAQQYYGDEFTELDYDELGLLPEERTWLFLISRVRSSNPAARLLIRGSANPGGPGHAWLKARYIEPTLRGERVYWDAVSGKSRAFIPGRLADNPSLGGMEGAYAKSLLLLPDQLRRQLLEGDWDAATGMAFGELDDRVHWIEGRIPPAWWVQWGGFDWGYAHWSVFVWFAQDDKGQVHVVDTLWMLRRWPNQQAEEVWERVRVDQLRAVYGGRDCWNEDRAKGPATPVVADEFIKARIPLVPASIDPKTGYAITSEALAYRGRGPGGEDVVPRVLFHRTPGNRRLFDQLRVLVTDPDDPRKVLKVNADQMTGAGGDDGYDAFRYGLLTFMEAAKDPALQAAIRAWDPAVLKAEAERTQRSLPLRAKPQRLQIDNQWEVDV